MSQRWRGVWGDFFILLCLFNELHRYVFLHVSIKKRAISAHLCFSFYAVFCLNLFFLPWWWAITTQNRFGTHVSCEFFLIPKVKQPTFGPPLSQQCVFFIFRKIFFWRGLFGPCQKKKKTILYSTIPIVLLKTKILQKRGWIFPGKKIFFDRNFNWVF